MRKLGFGHLEGWNKCVHMAEFGYDTDPDQSSNWEAGLGAASQSHSGHPVSLTAPQEEVHAGICKKVPLSPPIMQVWAMSSLI